MCGAAPAFGGPSETARRGPAARISARWAARGEARGASRSDADPCPAGAEGGAAHSGVSGSLVASDARTEGQEGKLLFRGASWIAERNVTAVAVLGVVEPGGDVVEPPGQPGAGLLRLRRRAAQDDGDSDRVVHLDRAGVVLVFEKLLG